MKKTFKLLSLSICILLMGAFFVGCSKDSSEQISFLNYGENIDKETIKEFEKKYGIKVNVETFDEMETMYQKISKGGVKYDVILVS
ncbi:type 2 periplasmic-binding domain-containing protein [Burkholderia pseudomallei]